MNPDIKVFEMTRLFFKLPPEYFTELDLPIWLDHKSFRWWFDGYIDKLDIGESIKSDFRIIKRIN